MVQKALETLGETDFPKFLSEFHNNVLSLIHDQNGNHVIQKCVEVVCQKVLEISTSAGFGHLLSAQILVLQSSETVKRNWLGLLLAHCLHPTNFPLNKQYAPLVLCSEIGIQIII